jgi:hypothetical protein
LLSNSSPPFKNDRALRTDENAFGLTDDWYDSFRVTCINHYEPSCGKTYVALLNCVDSSCDSETNCAGASQATFDACTNIAVGGGSGICGALAVTAFSSSSGVCKRAFPETPGAAETAELCFPLPAEDTSQWSGIKAYLSRVALYVCGPAR